MFQEGSRDYRKGGPTLFGSMALLAFRGIWA
jgi:hypothetical protein